MKLWKQQTLEQKIYTLYGIFCAILLMASIVGYLLAYIGLR